MVGNRITRCFRYGLVMNLAAPPRNPTISIVGGVNNQGQRDTLDFDADDSSISYDVADIVYSAVKRNGRIIESFTETSNS